MSLQVIPRPTQIPSNIFQSLIPTFARTNISSLRSTGVERATQIALPVHVVGSREIGNLPFVRFIRGKINYDAVRTFFHHPPVFLSASGTSSSSTAGSGAGASAEAAADKVVVAEVRAGECDKSADRTAHSRRQRRVQRPHQ